MAENQLAGTAAPSPLSGFTFVESVLTRQRGLALRDPEGLYVSPTGVVETNAAATDWFDDLALAQHLDVEKYCIKWGGNAATGQAAALVVAPGTPGATPVRRYTDKRSLTLYMTQLFLEQPRLRPASERWCVVTKEPDGNGGHFVLVHLNVALEQGKGKTRKKKQGAKPAAQQANKPAEKPADKPAEQPVAQAAPPQNEKQQA